MITAKEAIEISESAFAGDLQKAEDIIRVAAHRGDRSAYVVGNILSLKNIANSLKNQGFNVNLCSDQRHEPSLTVAW